MKVFNIYRLVKDEYSTVAFSGEGTEEFGGRWSSIGTTCVYTAGSESLAILEVFVHQRRNIKMDRYCLFELQIPEKDVLYLKQKQLPSNWRANPSPQETAIIGDFWLWKKKTLALAVPSAVVSGEWIYILNPQHTGFEQVVKKVKKLPFEFDARL